MFDITLESANLWFDRLNIISSIGAVVVAFLVYGAFRMGSIKEKFFDERVSINESATARANAESEKAKASAAIANENAAKANERANQLANEAAQTRERAALTEERLLDERRLTARERWRLERLERAVLPRTLTPEQRETLIPLLRGLGSINVAAVNKPEPFYFAQQLMDLFQRAGIMGRLLILPADSNQFGVATYIADANGQRLMDILWQQRIGGQGIGGGVRPIGLDSIPTDQNTLIVGENDAAFQPGDGQPGEGIDKHGGAVPAPQ